MHVGSPKTGTTYLQSVLWASRAELARQGLTLPLRRHDHFYLSVRLRGALDPDVDGPAVDSVLDRLGRALRRAEGDVLITNEVLAVATREGIAELKALLADFEVHVVVTARDWQRQLPAEWQQFVKTRHEGTFEHFLDAVHDHPGHRFWRGQDYAAIARRWGRDLPPSQVHVVTVPPSGSAPELLLERFCSVLGIDPSGIDTAAPRGNPSLAYEHAELMRRVNATLGDRLPKPRAGYNRVAKFWLAEQVLAPLPGTRIVVPAARRAWWHERSQRLVEELAEAGWDVVGDLTDLVADPRGAGAVEAPLVADDSQLLALALEGLAASLDQRNEDLSTIRELKKSLKRANRRSTAHDAPGRGPGEDSAEEPDEAAASTPTATARRLARGVRRRLGR